jgi:hypothetical protein
MLVSPANPVCCWARTDRGCGMMDVKAMGRKASRPVGRWAVQQQACLVSPSGFCRHGRCPAMGLTGQQTQQQEMTVVVCCVFRGGCCSLQLTPEQLFPHGYNHGYGHA